MPRIKHNSVAGRFLNVARGPRTSSRICLILFCLAFLTGHTYVWAGLTSLSVDADGDSIFRGGQDDLEIIFTVDVDVDDDDNIDAEGITYTVTVNQNLIERGTVLTDQTVRVSWDGSINGQQLPDGDYTIHVALNKAAGDAGEIERSAKTTLDATAPRISSIFANGDPNLLLINGSFVNTALRSITIIPEVDQGSSIDFGGEQTVVLLKDAKGSAVTGHLNYDTQLAFRLGNSLKDLSQNGKYTLNITLADKAGNTLQSTTEFIFDNVAPNLIGTATSRGPILSGAGVSGQLDFVEASLVDNLENAVSLSDSTVRLTGPAGEILGRQTFPSKNKIRWQLLSPLSPEAGLRDGAYTIEVVGRDQAGNQTETIRVPFIYDNLAPQLVSLGAAESGAPFDILGDTIYHNQPLTQIVATFDDTASGIGVNFERDTEILFSAIAAGGQTNRLTGRTFVDKNNGRVSYVLEQPLISQDGSYRLEVSVADLLGNRNTDTFQFLYDTQLPTLVSTFPEANQTVDNLSQVRVVLNEITSGIDFSLSNFRLTRNVGGTAMEVPVNITNNGTDTAILTVLEPIALDGSDDGTYTIEVTPTDRAGNVGATARREFYLISQSQPEIRLTVPEITTVNSLATIVTELIGYIGPGINFDESELTVRNAQGATVPQRQVEPDAGTTNVLTWQPGTIIPRDGTADGEYSLTATFVDFTGKRFTRDFSIFLDTQFPAIESVRLETESQPELFTDSTTTIAQGFSQINVTFQETLEQGLQTTLSDVDFANTDVTLTGPTGENIPINRLNDGATNLTLNFQALTQPGEYSLSITPQDLAGNKSAAPFVYRMRIDVLLPTVTSVLIADKLGTIVYVNGASTDIVANFEDPTGVGLDLDGSTITVTNPSGIPAPGTTTSNETNQLTWTPTVLPTDGSADGRYTVIVTPKDRAGRQGDVVYRQFIYDTQQPRVTASNPVALNQPTTYIGGTLPALQFTVEDIGPAGLELADQTIALFDAGPGIGINTTLTFDEINSQLYLTLDTPLAQDGSADGEYLVKVHLVDKAGNISESEHTFVYDSQVPQLTSVTVNTAVPVTLAPQGITEISESISRITLQFEEATRVDFTNTMVNLVGPDGQAISLNISADGLTQVTARFVELTQAGVYTLSVTPQDIAGNVAQGAVRYPFRLVFLLPSVSSIELGGQTGDFVFLNGSDSTIVATLMDTIGTGLDLGEGGSSIVVTNPSGAVVPGQTRADGTNQLIWEAVSLPTDGSADGRYTVAVTPVDKAGRQGDVVYRQFIYDTENPRITAASPIVLSQPVSYIRSGLNQLSFTVEDVGPADLLLEAQTIALVDSAGNAVPATLTSDELTNQLFLTLSAPLPRDGSSDGAYTVKFSLIDRAGNALDLEHLLIYDSQVPQLASVTVNTESPVELVPQGVTEISEPISSITLQFDEATRIDFENTVITLVSSDTTTTAAESTPVAIPLTLKDDGTSRMTVSFLELNQIGTYTLSVTPQDIAGNIATGATNYTFILDIPLPSVSTIIIGDTETIAGGDVAYANASNMTIGAEFLDPTETGLSFGSEGSTITVATPDGTVVPGRVSSNGVNLLVWQPITLTPDGTTDGRYSVYVYPVDKAGRQGNTAYREFIYDTQEPEITAAAPIDLSQPVSYISQSLNQFQFTVADVGPADLMLADQKVSLREASGNLVPAQLTDNTQNQLFLTLDQLLPLDGSMDGEYTLAIALVDKASNAYTVEHRIVYDTQAPTLVSTVPADRSLITEDITQVQVQLNDEGGSGINWAATTVTLVNPSGQQISGELISDGATALTLNTNQLVEDGLYIIRVQAADRAGNGGATVFERSFLLSRRLPAIVSTEPVTAPEDEAFTNEEIERIEVNLETDDENHLSTLRLLNPANQVIAGQQRRTSGRLIYDLVRPLATDGSEDGLYTIEFTPISGSGRSGEVQRLTFTYDTQAPEIESDDQINLVVAQPGVSNSLTEIRVTLTDDTSGIDWENLEEDWLTFERLSPNAAKISGRVDDDGEGNLTFRLAVPLADNGSADGEYRITVNPKDRAGNDDDPYQRVFIYDTSPPMIDTGTLLINDTPLIVDINADNYPTAVSTTGGVVIQANIFDTGLGVNLAQSKITVRRPDGAEIPGNIQQNGVDTILFKSDGLALQGKYQVEVTSIGNDSELLGFAPSDSLTTEFLYETREPTATLTSDGGATELTDEPLPLEGTAVDSTGTQRIGEGEIPVPASGVWLVEIVGTGPDDQPIDPVPAVDDSNAQEDPWSRWSIDFLPTRSGEYDLDVRVTDNAGNYAVYDIGKYTMSVSLTFRGSTFGWPNPLRLSQRDVAFFSFDVNVPLGETIELTLSIYDWSGDMVLSQTYPNVVSGQRNDQLVKWNLENQAGTPVARGLYIFRLEAVNGAGNRANTVGKVLVVD